MPTLRLFASAREAAGTARTEIEADTVAEILDKARRQFGERFGKVLETSRVWVNGQPAEMGTTISGHDVVAVLPPVSGGSTPPAAARAIPPPAPGGGAPGAESGASARPEPAAGLEGAGGAASGSAAPDPGVPPSRPARPVRPVRPSRRLRLVPPPASDEPVPDGPSAPPSHPSPVSPALVVDSGGRALAPAARAGPAPEPDPSPDWWPPAPPAPSPITVPSPITMPSPVTPPSPVTIPEAAPVPGAMPLPMPAGQQAVAAAVPEVAPAVEPKPAAPLAVVHQSTRPHGRLGVAWAVVTLGVLVAGPGWLAVWMAVIAFVAASQTASVWRKRGERPLPAFAAATAAALPLTAITGPHHMSMAVAAAVVFTLVARLASPTKAPGRDVGLTLVIGLSIGMAAAAPVMLRSINLPSALYLLACAALYDAGAYLVGTGASSVWEGPAAGVVALIPLTMLAALAFVPPFHGGAPLLLGALAAALAPFGPVAGSALLGDRTAHAPALRRLDSLLILGPIWAWCAAALLI